MPIPIITPNLPTKVTGDQYFAAESNEVKLSFDKVQTELEGLDLRIDNISLTPGADGDTPYIQSGNWWIGGVDTDTIPSTFTLQPFTYRLIIGTGTVSEVGGGTPSTLVITKRLKVNLV